MDSLPSSVFVLPLDHVESRLTGSRVRNIQQVTLQMIAVSILALRRRRDGRTHELVTEQRVALRTHVEVDEEVDTNLRVCGPVWIRGCHAVTYELALRGERLVCEGRSARWRPSCLLKRTQSTG